MSQSDSKARREVFGSQKQERTPRKIGGRWFKQDVLGQRVFEDSELFGFPNNQREMNKRIQNFKRFLKGNLQCASQDRILGQKGNINGKSLESGS